MAVKGKLRRVWKQAVVEYFKIQSQFQETNPGFSEYQTGLLTEV
jgi:hypothetical protein